MSRAPGQSEQDFERERARGQRAEDAIAAHLARDGFAVLSVSEFAGTDAPCMLVPDGNRVRRHVLPDLVCWGGGVCWFVEVKLKDAWVHWRGVVETGLEARNFDHYAAVGAATASRVAICFVHERLAPRGVFVAWVADLAGKGRLWDGLSPTGQRIVKEPMVLFPSALVRHYATLEEIGWYEDEEQVATRPASGGSSLRPGLCR